MTPPARASASPSFPSLVLISIVVGGLGGAGASLLVRPGDSGMAVPAGPTADLERVIERLDTLERDATRTAATGAPVAVQEAATGRQPATPPDAALTARVEALEKAVAALASRPAPAAQGVTGAPAATPRPQDDPAARLAESQQTILDLRKSEDEKLRAWSQLRNMPDSWNDAIVATMTQIGLGSANPATRANVWRQADGGSKRHPAMRAALLQALATDAHAEAREEAAETLENYLDEAGVRDALEHASRTDTEPKVQAQALRSLRSSNR